jgi:hypothetical protein
MKYRAVCWPNIRRIANYDLQIFFECDPYVVQFFDPKLHIDVEPEGEDMHLFELSAHEWTQFGKAWLDTENQSKETSIYYH